MVYDWQGYRDECYQMYITEKKALEEIMEYMKATHNFAPSKRAFQTQFKRWGFPSKQNPAHKNVSLVARVRDLWEKNTSQRDMLETLNAEGFEIKERELMRVRAKNRWLLRVPNGMKAHGHTEALIDETPSNDDADLMASLQQEVYPQAPVEVPTESKESGLGRAISPPLAPEVIQKRKERFDRLQAESEARYAARKRRRRTRGWAGLPADPPAPPRFPSETTIDESKTYLDLDNERYRDLRDQFQAICEGMGIIKKTTAGTEVWQAAKERLIGLSLHLGAVFIGDINPQYTKEQKHLALDVICTDVTKRMRTLERRMTIAEAKNALGVNPDQSREIRNAFYNTLKADHFTSKLEAGDEHWKELKEEWIQNSDLLQSILQGGEADPEHETKLKAMEVLCRDVMKRLRDDQTKRDPNRKAADSPQQPDLTMPPPALPRPKQPSATRTGRAARQPKRSAIAATKPEPTMPTSDISALASSALAHTPITDSRISDLQIDPTLLAVANPSPTSSYLPASDPIFQQQQPSIPSQSITPVPVYIRISPTSTTTPAVSPPSSKLHLARLNTPRISELRSIISHKFPKASTSSIHGVAGGVSSSSTVGGADGASNSTAGADDDGGLNGGEIMWRIDTDPELEGYLDLVKDGKAVFVVMFN